MAEHAHTIAAPAGAQRSRVERHIERHLARAEELIALLDAADGEPDLEDSDEDVACEDEGARDADWIPDYLIPSDQTGPVVVPGIGIFHHGVPLPGVNVREIVRAQLAREAGR